jgi:hypothetical protein
MYCLGRTDKYDGQRQLIKSIQGEISKSEGNQRSVQGEAGIRTLPSGASDTVRSEEPAYVAAVDGALTLKSGNDTRTLRAGKGFSLLPVRP